MPVRSLRPTDMVGLASFHRKARGTEITAHTWPQVEPDSAPLPYLSIASTAFAQRPNGQRVWVAQSDGGIAGVALAKPRAGGLAWDIQHLYACEGADQAAVDLLERAIAHAAAHGARRVFLALPSGGRGEHVARRAAFERFTCTAVYALTPGFQARRTDLFEARPRLRSDDQPLFQLYSAAVPAPVRAAEGLTMEEWLGLHVGRGRWQPTVTGTRQQYVWELGTSIVGWMEVTFGQRSQLLQILVHPRYAESVDKLLRYALLQVSPKAPVYVAVRDYQGSVAAALEQLGFRSVSEHDVYVRMLAVRVPEARLVPAKVVGG